MATTRTQVLDAMELAVVVLSAISPDGGRREDFVETTGIDPSLVDQGRGRRAARILQGVVAALRDRNGGSPSGVREEHYKGAARSVEGSVKSARRPQVEAAR
jgi:hypothetical protein